MAFTFQMVVTTGSGRTVGILETRKLKATTLADAKVEADRRVRRLRHPAFAAIEILDDTGTVIARRPITPAGRVAPTLWVMLR
jgi:hypothetical protein